MQNSRFEKLTGKKSVERLSWPNVKAIDRCYTRLLERNIPFHRGIIAKTRGSTLISVIDIARQLINWFHRANPLM